MITKDLLVQRERLPVRHYPAPQRLVGEPRKPHQIAPQQRPDDGYIYPADGSSDEARYPAPRTTRRLYDAQAYPQPQQQYYNNPGYAPAPPPARAAPAPQGYYQPRSFFQQRGYYQD